MLFEISKKLKMDNNEGKKKKPCNCGKGKPKESEFSVEPEESGGFSLRSRLGMVQKYAMSLRSRGFRNKKTSKSTKQLRVLSCFGDQHVGGELPPCEHLSESKTEGKYFCGGCGCGDRKATWLISDGDEYSKLDYPKLQCPLQHPGFTNYRPSHSSEAEEPVSRKHYMENISYKDLEKVPVTTPEMSEEQKRLQEETLKKRKEAMKNKNN